MFEWLLYPLHFCSRGRETARRFPGPPRSLRPPGGTLSYWPIVLSLQSSLPPSCTSCSLFLSQSSQNRSSFLLEFSPDFSQSCQNRSSLCSPSHLLWRLEDPVSHLFPSMASLGTKAVCYWLTEGDESLKPFEKNHSSSGSFEIFLNLETPYCPIYY